MKFEVKVVFPQERGEKIVMEKEVYLIDADLFGEAEAIAQQHMPPVAQVIEVKISKIENVVGYTPDLEGECPFFFFENKDDVEHEDGKVTKRSLKALVHGFDVDDCKADFKRFLEHMEADTNITKIQKTLITKIIKKEEE